MRILNLPQDHKGRTLTWTEQREVIAAMVVQTEAEEDAVRAAFDRAEELGIAVQEHWTPAMLMHAVSLAEMPKPRRNAPRPTPEQVVANRIATLKAELAALEPVETMEAGAAPAAPPPPPDAPAAKRHRATPLADLPVVAPDPAV